MLAVNHNVFIIHIIGIFVLITELYHMYIRYWTLNIIMKFYYPLDLCCGECYCSCLLFVVCCLYVFQSMCLFVLCVLCMTVFANCLLNKFAMYVGEVIVISLKVIVLL